MRINPDATLSELFNEWNSGLKSEVIFELARDHAGLVAVFIAQGVVDGRLTWSDVNEIANRLIDIRKQLVDDNRLDG